MSHINFTTFLLERSQQKFKDFYYIIHATANRLFQELVNSKSSAWTLIQAVDNEQKTRNYLSQSFSSSQLDEWLADAFQSQEFSDMYHLPEHSSLPLTVLINVREHKDSFYCSGYIIPSREENTLALHIMLHNSSLDTVSSNIKMTKEGLYQDITSFIKKQKPSLKSILTQSDIKDEIKSTLHHELTHIFQKTIRLDFNQTYGKSIDYEHGNYHWHKSSYEFESVLSEILLEVKKYLSKAKKESRLQEVTALEIYSYIFNSSSNLVKKMLKMRKKKTLQAIQQFMLKYIN